MISVFWPLLAILLGGLFMMLMVAILARHKRHPLRTPSRPLGSALLRAAGRNFLGVLWTMSHPFGYWYGGRQRYDFDPSKDYVREHHRRLEDERNRADRE